MVSTIATATLIGVDAQAIEVEVELAPGLPFLSIIGLGDAAVQEARYRIMAALRESSIELPKKKATINLAPASIRKDGASLDLPMALGLLVAAGCIGEAELDGTLAVGELALTGAVRPIRGALPIAALAKRLGLRRVIVPEANGPEAKLIEGLEVLAPSRLLDLILHFRKERLLPEPERLRSTQIEDPHDLSEVRGQERAKRALEVAAAGEHNLLMLGPPGSGKTMLARRLSSILPPLPADEQIEVTKVWSAAGLTIGRRGLVTSRPFRAPHHSVSPQALIGGGSIVRPGEVSLAHRGVLFLDEAPELARGTLESLRQPLEDRNITIARARQVVQLPAAFMLVAAANPCPCGWFGDASHRCNCTPEEVHRYGSRISGPLLDRIDLVVEVPAVSADQLLGVGEGERSSEIRCRVERARLIAAGRFGAPNGRLSHRQIEKHGDLRADARQTLRDAMEQLQLSARVIGRCIRVARTLADLEAESEIHPQHVEEALQYRPPKSWTGRRAA